MTAATLAEAVASIREMLADGTATEVTCEISRHGTIKIAAKKAEPTPVEHQWKARRG